MLSFENFEQIALKKWYAKGTYLYVKVVNMEFSDGATASFTMIAFSEKLCVRTTRVFGTHGELSCSNGSDVRHFDFRTGTAQFYAEAVEQKSDLASKRSIPRGGGHGGNERPVLCHESATNEQFIVSEGASMNCVTYSSTPRTA
jgi:hypothetical protein